MTKQEFEQRAAQMKELQLAKRQFRTLPPPRSIFEPRRQPIHANVKVHLRDLVPQLELSQLGPIFSGIKRLRTVETDRDGLIDLKGIGIGMIAGPELLARSVRLYDAILKAARERGWPLKTSEGAKWRIDVNGEPVDLVIAEKTDPMSDTQVRPGQRRPRRPAGALTITFSAGYRNAMVSEKRGKTVESKIEELFLKAEALAVKARAERERQRQLEYRQRLELSGRIERLDRNLAAWKRAQDIRAYAEAMEKQMLKQGQILLESNEEKWLSWVRRYADAIDPTRGAITVQPQEFWE